MSTELILCVSQEKAEVPFKFKMTGINVYTFEEALYHCYHYWKQSVDEFTSDEFISWVNDALGLSYLASKIKLLANIDGLTSRMIAFLSLTDYFDASSLAMLKEQLTVWGARLEWERMKERGDYLMNQDDPGLPSLFYKKALAFSENAAILNNLAIAMLRLERFEDGVRYLERALTLEEGDVRLYLSLAEAAILNHEFDKATRALKRAEEMDSSNADIQYLYGELNFAAGNTRYSIEYLERAIQSGDAPHYSYRLADVYVKLRQYEKALDCLNKIKVKDKDVLLKQAEVHAISHNIPAAIRCVERALMTERGSAELWVRLAMYHRLDYEIDRANRAITKALSIAPENNLARLENARIKKAMGWTKEYQTVLHDILLGFRRKYRDTPV